MTRWPAIATYFHTSYWCFLKADQLRHPKSKITRNNATERILETSPSFLCRWLSVFCSGTVENVRALRSIIMDYCRESQKRININKSTLTFNRGKMRTPFQPLWENYTSRARVIQGSILASPRCGVSQKHLLWDTSNHGSKKSCMGGDRTPWNICYECIMLAKNMVRGDKFNDSGVMVGKIGNREENPLENMGDTDKV